MRVILKHPIQIVNVQSNFNLKNIEGRQNGLQTNLTV